MYFLDKLDPLRELDDFSNRLSTMFGRLPLTQKRNGESGLPEGQWTPLVDITEDDHEYLIKAELPGVEKKEVKVTVEEGMLVISGARKSEHEEKDRKYHRIERIHGSFMRSFALPDNADGAKVLAEFKDGVLQVHLPKKENAKAKPIEIDVK